MKIGAWEASLDLYAVLGVSEKASSERIRSAYRRRIFESHPDLQGQVDRTSADARAKQINLAGAILLDPSARARYDAMRAARRPRPAPPVREGYRPEPRDSDFWPFMRMTPAAPGAVREIRFPRPPPIDGLSATVLLVASFLACFSFLVWLAAPPEPAAGVLTSQNEPR